MIDFLDKLNMEKIQLGIMLKSDDPYSLAILRRAGYVHPTKLKLTREGLRRLRAT